MELSEKMKDSIDNYGNRIQSIKDFMAAVRKRPGVYLGPIGNAGFINMMRETYQNAMDQLLDPQSPCNHWSFSYNENTKEVIVTDNGLGFPRDDVIRMLTKPHVSKNFTPKLYDYHSGYNGAGEKVVNAMSETMIVKSYKYDGTAFEVEFHAGQLSKKGIKDIPNKEKKQGSIVYFVPDETVLGEVTVEWRTIYRLIKETMSLTPIGSNMDFEAIDLKGIKYTEHIVNKDGILSYIIDHCEVPIIKPITVLNDDGQHRLECAFDFDGGSGDDGPSSDPTIKSFCNFSPTMNEKSTHVNGTIDGICKWFVQYMNNIYLANQKAKNKLRVLPSDIKSCGLVVMINACHWDPQYNAQAKERLSNPDMVPFCRDTMMKGLDEWSRSNPQDLAKISKFIKEIAEVRQRSETAKTKIVTKYHANVLTGLPMKYKKPTGKKDIELIIVEGDSALGTVEQGRDPKTQGLFPIRGKIINAFSSSKEKFFNNEEVQGITKIILGSDYKKGFDVKDCKVSKVIFMADADVDFVRLFN